MLSVCSILWHAISAKHEVIAGETLIRDTILQTHHDPLATHHTYLRIINWKCHQFMRKNVINSYARSLRRFVLYHQPDTLGMETLDMHGYFFVLQQINEKVISLMTC